MKATEDPESLSKRSAREAEDALKILLQSRKINESTLSLALFICFSETFSRTLTHGRRVATS
jgi:hypothetical protein